MQKQQYLVVLGTGGTEGEANTLARQLQSTGMEVQVLKTGDGFVVGQRSAPMTEGEALRRALLIRMEHGINAGLLRLTR